MPQRTERWILNHLIETCKDGEQGFLSASGHVEGPELKTLFEQMAAERSRMAADLLPHAQRLGGDAAADGTGAAALHRRWIDIKSLLKRHDDHAIVIEVERGNRITLQVFKDALEDVIPPASRDLIERLYTALQQSHDRIAALDKARSARA